MAGRSKNLRSGAVLIVVLGVLAILALLATTFATLQRVDRVASRNYLDLVRARLIAGSAVEEAIVRMEGQAIRDLMSGAPSGADPSRYWGGNVTEDETLSAVPTPLREARNPSFAMEIDKDPLLGSPLPVELMVEGRSLGLSGIMSSGTYGRKSEIFSSRVSDCSSKIHINMGMGAD